MADVKSEVEMMQRAVELAKRGLGHTRPNPAVGAVIARGGRIVGEGWHKRAGGDHAEVAAIKNAARRGEKSLKGSTIYVTLEPCQMCAGAIVQARIPLVVIGCKNEKAGCAGSILNLFNVEKFNHQVETIEGVLEEECSKMLTEFFKGLRQRLKSEKDSL